MAAEVGESSTGGAKPAVRESRREKLTKYRAGKLAERTLEGKWNSVVEMYMKYPGAQTQKITEDNDNTALHVAVDLKIELVVKLLVEAIIEFEEAGDEEALKVQNKNGDTPLHLAASRGFTKICMYIIGESEERIHLLRLENKKGETPFFLAALNWNAHTFAYLSSVADKLLCNSIKFADDIRCLVTRGTGEDINKRESILHCAINREYFDLAFIIARNYTFLTMHAHNGITPLHVLAKRPSAFKSTTKLSFLKQMLYHIIPVRKLDADKEMEKYKEEIQWLQSSNGSKKIGFLPPNYDTIFHFMKSVYVLSPIRRLVEAFKEVRETKQKHIWSFQLLDKLMENPFHAFTGGMAAYNGGSRPTDSFWDYYFDPDDEALGLLIREPYSPSQMVLQIKEGASSIYDDNNDTEGSASDDNKETPYLLAAKHGIIEMVTEIQQRIPSVIHITNAENQNVLLVAVKNRQPQVVLELKKQLPKEVWEHLVIGVDDDENTLLHLAAQGLEEAKSWKVASHAMQLMWDIKWYQYIKEIVPRHFHNRSNNESKTAVDIFNTTHEGLIKNASEWLKETSESCSVVAVLVAGVSFATAGNVPGGYDNGGEATLGGQPAFEVFAMASLVGLCFSVTGLIMFLSILTSRQVAIGFRSILPKKLLIGLSSLFLSIITMFVSFCSAHFFLVNHNKYKSIIFPLYAATSIPVAFYAFEQFPLYFHLLSVIFATVPTTIKAGELL
ncbi:hypothetical protein HN51_049755 [Arachis hypogaea]|uniref:uncharacterized protein n=1 Tax=Arachis hypogaea TaxID=3818 RepID=UPI000DED4E6E|nr:uncharacterized protein LOC112767230 [Arachis hypogaea]QHN91365.1 uncharacterized protein DS421_17g574240 [Arachis hypogaea]